MRHVVYLLDLSMTLTFDLYVGGGGILSEFYSQFLSCFSKLSSTPEDTLAKYEGLSFTCMYVICKELKFALKAAYLGRIGIVISQH